MLATLFCEHFNVKARNLAQIHKLSNSRLGIPCIYFTHDWRGPSGAARTLSLETDKRRFSDRKVLMLVRDPRDVVVSNFFEKKYRDKSFDGDIHEFVQDPILGIQGIVDYYTVWARERSVTSEYAVFRYEDMHRDVVREMLRILGYCGVNGISREHVADVANRFTFDRMQRMERDGKFSSKSMSPGDVDKPESYKARSGKIGSYREHLSAADLDYIEKTIRTRLDPWFNGYHAGRDQ